MVQPVNYGGMVLDPLMSGLQTGLGVGQAISQKREQEQQQENLSLVQQQFKDAYSSGDMNKLAELSIMNPEIGDQVNKAIGYRSAQTKEIMANTLGNLLTAPPEQRASIINAGISAIEKAGGNPENLRRALNEDHDTVLKSSIVALGGLGDTGKGYLEAYKMTQQGGAPEYSNVQFDEAGNPFGLNKTTGQYEPIQGGFQRAKPTPQTVVNMGTQGLTEEQKALAKQRVNRYGKITDDADAASQEIDSINQIRAIDLDTGFGTEVKSTAAKVINTLGGNGEALLNVNVSDVEKFNAVAEKQVLNVMSSQKGPQTDQDAARIKKTVAGTENTKEANAFILDSMEAIANRKIEQQAFWDSYLENNDGTLKGVQSAWNQYKKETPMVSDVVKNPATGKPMFFYQFRAAFPDRDEAEVIQAWRKLTGGK